MIVYLVFDIGGTNTKFGVFRNNKLLEIGSFKTINSNKLLKELIFKINEIKERYKIRKFKGIVISAPGYLESEKLKLTAPTNLKNVKNLSLVCLKKYCKKLILENDANCAALGAFVMEKRKQNVRGNGNIENLACFTLGTGFGCGLILAGKLYKGNGNASEFGHSIINFNEKEKKCNCGNLGCVESYISIKGLLRIAEKYKLKGNSYELAYLARKNNKKAKKVFKEFSERIAVTLINIVNTLDLEVVYLTGGLVNISDVFLKEAVKKAKKGFFKGMNPKIKIRKENLSLLGGLELVK